jgi:hypothetical protein
VGASVCATDPTHCANSNQFVFTQRYTIGNTTLRGGHPSLFGDPDPNDLNMNVSAGQLYSIPAYIASNNGGYQGGYMYNNTDVSSFSLLPKNQRNSAGGFWSGDTAYVVEVFFKSTVGTMNQGGQYAYAVF